MTLTATITPSDASGTVNFLNNGSTIAECGAKAVVGGVATCETEALVTQGYHTITANFTGNGSFTGQTGSNELGQVVAGLSATTLYVSPSQIVFGMTSR